MQRRDFIAGLAGAPMLPLAARATSGNAGDPVQNSGAELCPGFTVGIEKPGQL